MHAHDDRVHRHDCPTRVRGSCRDGDHSGSSRDRSIDAAAQETLRCPPPTTRSSSAPARPGHSSPTGSRPRDDGRHRRAEAVRRHLREHRLHSHQDDGRQRLRRAHGAARRRVRRRRSTAASRVDMKRVKARKDAISGESRDRRREVAADAGELHRLQGHARFRVGPRGQRRRRSGSTRRADLHQRRRPRHRCRRCPGSTRSRTSPTAR